ncbi:hypothetical protein FRX31_031601 [Thalictrum thalictroides]|uniref:Uncharacterized protein n=1 Tax=Thalictrum thalictroides TaxID=46969 RepID=A0A7J6V1X9_THATH|nr:hypothetical protein FRX31_031601 [Thalictrum thalictroides]
MNFAEGRSLGSGKKMELKKAVVTNVRNAMGRKLVDVFKNDFHSEHVPVAVYVDEDRPLAPVGFAQGATPPALGHVENSRPPPPSPTNNPRPPGHTDSRPPGHVEDFRPTAPGHSPGIGHSIHN